jgi:cadmium resistance protein CadD (predicted permease)
VSSLPGDIAVAGVLFAGANVDDVVVLVLLSATSRATGRPSRWQLWGGQFVGFALLAAVALAAGRGLTLIPEGWLWPIALVPIGLGIWYLAAAVRTVRSGNQPDPPSAGGMAGVTMLALVNGSDSLAAFTPYFATSDWGTVTVTLVVFAAGVVVWCAAGWLLVRHERVTAAAARYGPWILPAAFILIGCWTLHQTGALG